jgi:hypothetical protein
MSNSLNLNDNELQRKESNCSDNNQDLNYYHKSPKKNHKNSHQSKNNY